MGIEEIISSYDKKDIRITTVCSHSSLQIFNGARKEGFKSIGIAIKEEPSFYKAFPLGKPDEFFIVENYKKINDRIIQFDIAKQNEKKELLLTYSIKCKLNNSNLKPVIFGKLSFSEAELENNLKSFIKVIREAKPAVLKGTFIKSITLASTMGPGIRLDLSETLKEL